jgi:hypothetical protein
MRLLSNGFWRDARKKSNSTALEAVVEIVVLLLAAFRRRTDPGTTATPTNTYRAHRHGRE